MTPNYYDPPTPLIEIKDLRFGYSERMILDGINLVIPKGQVTAIMGASRGSIQSPVGQCCL